jgi:NAD(P)-dependent dehydrogenase (short-subunit alcohol dehydrogenase family)
VALHADVGDPAATRRAVAEGVDRLGGLDGLVSNAGISRPGPLLAHPVEDWDRVFAVNARATLVLAQAAHEALREARGALVAVASMSGMEPHAHLASYGPSKAALIMLVRVLAQELARDGIRVNAVSPGMVRTQMTAQVYADERLAAERAALVPLGRVAGPADIADVIAFLLSPDARYLTGANLLVDGGLTGNLLGRLPGLSRITRR